MATWRDLALTCPRTCGLCDDANPTSCQLPGSWRGSWTDAATGAAVTVNDTAIHVIRRTAAGDDEVDALTMGCVRWRTDTGDGGVDNEAMLVTVYGAGCRPRYRCARVLRRSASLLYLQFSDAASWPLVRSPRDPVDCAAFHFDRWTTSPPALTSSSSSSASSTSGYLLSLVADGQTSADCRLPSDVAGVQYDAEFVVEGARSSDRCSGTLSESGRSLRLAVSGCGSAVRRQFADPVYRCIESSAESRGDLVIIASGDGRSGSSSTLFCWLFTRRSRHRGRSRVGRPSSSLSFYLLSGDQCHAAVAAQSPSSFRPSRPLVYTALFSRPRSSSTAITPRPQTTPTQSPAVAESATPSSVRTSKNPQRPRPRNVTTTDWPEKERGGFVNAFVVGSAAVIMAVIQLIIICRC